MKLQSERYYDDSFDKKLYREEQIVRHAKKMYKKRDGTYYMQCANELIKFVNSDNLQMLCLGTRNNHERDSFSKALESKKVSVFSLDISPKACVDFTMDFNDFPEDWSGKWDIVFTNSIDHALDATKAFREFLRIVKNGGILMIGFDLVNTYEVNSVDCNTFEGEHVKEFLEKTNGVDIVGKVVVGYEHFVLRKVE